MLLCFAPPFSPFHPPDLLGVEIDRILQSISQSSPKRFFEKKISQAEKTKTHLLLRLHLRNGIHIMLVANPRHALPQRNHPRLHTHSLQLRAPKLVRTPRQLGPIHPVIHRHLPTMDLQDLRPRLLVRQWELNLPIQPPAPQQRRIQHIDAIRRREDFNAVVGREAIELVEEFEHRALDLPVAGFFAVEALRAHGVELVDEDDRGGFFFREGETVTDQLGAVADEHLDELRAGELEEGGVCLGGARAGEEGFAGAGGTVH